MPLSITRSGGTGWARPSSFAPLGIDATALRLVHGEADLLPSLIVDRTATTWWCRRCRRAWTG
jgi:hypothetical protein